MELKIDRSNWQKVKLGEVAFEYAKRINNPSESEYDRFVGSNNIGQWDFRVKSWESTDSVSSAMKLFEPNDYLLVRRSLYASDFRERAPRAHFHGVCSGDILTIKENPKMVVDGFLIGILNSPALWKFVVANASGSITRRIKWKDLAKYEFLLPPKDQQIQLAELLWAMDEVIEREREVLIYLQETYTSLVDNLFTKPKENWEYKPLKKIAKINSNSLKSSTDPNYEFQYLDIAGIVEPKVIGQLKTMKFSDAPSRAKRIIDDNSIVISMVRPYQKSFVFVENAQDIIASTGTGVIKVNDGIKDKFVFHQFFSKKFLRYCEDRMSGTNYPAITPIDLEQYRIGIAKDLELMQSVSNKLEEFDKSANALKSKIITSKSLQKSLINQIF